MSNWFKQVTEQILKKQDDYIATFFPESTSTVSGKNIKLDPCPFCGHDGCFSMTRGYNAGHCFSVECKVKGNLIKLVELKYGEIEGRQALADWSNIPYDYSVTNRNKLKLRKSMIDSNDYTHLL